MAAGGGGGGAIPNTVAFSLGAEQFMVTPGNCTDSATPVCDGGTDTLKKAWSTEFIYAGASSDTDGAANTATLAALGTKYPAAKYCADMVYGGYSDWFLPSKDQSIEIYVNRVAIGVGSFPLNGFYWTSTEYPNVGWMYGFMQYMEFGAGALTSQGKNINYYIRCIRKI